MRTWKNLAAIILIAILLSSITVQAANPHASNPHAKEDPKINEALEEKAEREFEIAKDSLENVEVLLEKLSEENVPITAEKELIKDAEKLLAEAELALESNPTKALTISKHIQALTKIIAHNLEKKLKEVEHPPENESKRLQLKKDFESLKEKALKLLAELERIAGAAETEQIKETLENALSFIKEGSASEDLASAAASLEKARGLIGKSESLLKSILANASTSATAAMNATSRKPEENLTRAEVSMNISIKFSESEINIEQTSVVESPQLENVSVTKMSIAASNGSTSITISKKIRSANRSIEAEISIEKNQSVLGGVVSIRNGNVSSVILVKNLSIKPLKMMKKNELRLKVEAPPGSPGKLVIVKLDPSAFRAEEIKKIKVYVNGSEAVLASSVLDLVSEVYDEPAYVFVFSSEGISVLIYLPHFSGYTIDIIGVIRETISSLGNVLNEILTRDTCVYSTILATIILMIAASLYVRRKTLLYRI